MSTHFILMILAALLGLSAFFSAGETAFMSASRVKLKNALAQGKKRAAAALKLLHNYDKLITTVLIGNNVVNIASSGLAAVLFVRFIGDAGVSVATLVMTVLVIIFGEITPKTLAREAPEQFAMATAPVFHAIVVVFTPLTALIVRWKALVMRFFRVRGDRSITEAELLTFVEEARQEGGINEREEVMIKRTINFDECTAREICTPRVDIAAVPRDASVEAIDACFRETRFSRLPVYESSIDNIVGIILYKDFRYDVLGGSRAPRDVIKSVVYVPESMKAPRLLSTMQSAKSHLSVVLDEFGGTAGIVTIEDIVEELVGEIWDEHDEVIQNITPLDARRIRILGRTPLKEIFARYHIVTEDDASITLATWILEHSGGGLRAGAEVSFYGARLTITKLRHNRVIEAVIK